MVYDRQCMYGVTFFFKKNSCTLLNSKSQKTKLSLKCQPAQLLHSEVINKYSSSNWVFMFSVRWHRKVSNSSILRDKPAPGVLPHTLQPVSYWTLFCRPTRLSGGRELLRLSGMVTLAWFFFWIRCRVAIYLRLLCMPTWPWICFFSISNSFHADRLCSFQIKTKLISK